MVRKEEKLALDDFGGFYETARGRPLNLVEKRQPETGHPKGISHENANICRCLL
jgi:hypothetical protein